MIHLRKVRQAIFAALTTVAVLSVKTSRWIYVHELQQSKYYVGSTNNLDRRQLEHTGKSGAIWTAINPPVKTNVHVWEERFPQHENFGTYLVMSVYGFNNVRGGKYCKGEDLSEHEIVKIKEKLHQFGVYCLVCNSKSHFTCECKSRHYDLNSVDLIDTAASFLNKAQSEAVQAESNGPTIVIAGAGTGKTKTLTHRIARLVAAGIDLSTSIFVTTFTAKAANEMLHRLTTLTSPSELESIDFSRGLSGFVPKPKWVGTFHKLCLRILLVSSNDVTFSTSLKIIDDSQQKSIIKNLIKELGLGDAVKVDDAVAFIANQKEQGLRAGNMDGDGIGPLSQLTSKSKFMLTVSSRNKGSQQFSSQQGKGDVELKRLVRDWSEVYTAYEKFCDRKVFLDFNEIILRVYELLRDDEHWRKYFQEQFQHILVDEFQDTNKIQFQLLRLLAGEKGSNLFLVGDDDQSIYGFRGASTDLIPQVSQQYPSTTLVKLEQNYRSTGAILRAANAVIAGNKARVGKTLWTSEPLGHKVGLLRGVDDKDEANLIRDQILRLTGTSTDGAAGVDAIGASHFAYGDCAVLYRTNAQARLLEKALLGARVPCMVVKGTSFFQREEVKHVMAYLGLVANRHDDASFERILNFPPRGIGAATVTSLETFARMNPSMSLWSAAKAISGEDEGEKGDAAVSGDSRQPLPIELRLKGKRLQSLKSFLSLIDDIDAEAKVDGLPVHEIIDLCIKKTGIITYYLDSEADDKTADSRIDNMNELVEGARDVEPEVTNDDEFGRPPLVKFLQDLALQSSLNTAQMNAVQLMSIHGAKGLEFPVVFVAGVEEGLIPSALGSGSAEDIEEERRLFYVAMTRARKRLFLSFVSRRLNFASGRTEPVKPSRFLRDIPANLISLK